VTSTPPRRSGNAARRFKRGAISVLWALAGVVLVIVMWELVKWLGTVMSLPFDSSDGTMPHVWTIFDAFSQPEVRGSDTTVLEAVIASAARSLLIAAGGFIIGVSVGLLLAIIMQRFAFMERGLLPFVIASQTVPLIALAPLIVGIGNRISFGPIQWNTTYSVMFIAAYLAFFPLLRGHAQADAVPSPLSFIPALPCARPQGLGSFSHHRHGGRRDLHRRQRWHRPIDHRVRP
jgi:NitT/TauT family transport system permease protein